MSPYLTIKGRWLLLSGLAFLLTGALLSDSLILFLGQVQIVLLSVSFMLIVPGAVALDRRYVRFRITSEERGHIVTDDVAITVEILNESTSALYAISARPFGTRALDMTSIDPVSTLPSYAKVARAFHATIAQSGRWMIHGFDVCISDPLGLIETKDYLPCEHALEFYPRVVRSRNALPKRGLDRHDGGQHMAHRVGFGTEIRELREYQPGDPLRTVAWKATVRRNRLMSKNYEHETSMSVYLMLDISTSMRGGSARKLEHAGQIALSVAGQVLKNKDAVGLMTFDEKLYGHVLPASSGHHMQRLIHHVMGINAIVDPDLTEIDDDELSALLADYLLIQERLDFRKGDEVDELSGVNERLLRRWVNSVWAKNKQEYNSPVLTEGLYEQKSNRLRRFAQLRGVEIPYRVEARLGMKERGLYEAIEQMMTTKGKHFVVIISDLCGIMNLDIISRGIELAMLRGHRFKFIVPFTPAYDDPERHNSTKHRVLGELFTSSEREERDHVIGRLRSLNVEVEWTRPTGTRL